MICKCFKGKGLSGTSIFAILLLVLSMPMEAKENDVTQAEENMVQGGMVLTVAQGKRLIAKGVAEAPIVKKALKDGMVIITKGTTNTYVAEELLGKRIEPGALVSGRIYPEKNAAKLPETKPLSEIVLVKGEYKPEITLAEALEKLQPGDVVIKGGNALDYPNKTAAVMVGAPDGGTIGRIMPYIVARKAHLIIPIGLEKQISGNVIESHLKMREPMESLNPVPSQFLLTGEIVTEIEALKILADVEAFQAAAGGIGGAEGGSWLIVRGKRDHVKKALEIAKSI